MEKRTIKSEIDVCRQDELSEMEQLLVNKAIEATDRAYAAYSHFRVGAALLLANGEIVLGCNQENAAYPVTICAERSALFSAGAQYPDQPVVAIAIAARDESGQLLGEPITPCGSCRQAMIETERRYSRKVKILLYGTERIYVIDGIGQLMPLSFTDDMM
ncbi:MAG: cytidine deaminase [Prevotella sp.]|nr:cytidine deaminase [Prevotella sp.]